MEKVRITKSNCTFVRPGDETEITTVNGVQQMWSESLHRYERLSWVTHVWGVEYEEITTPPVE
ncbi:hypothetical protein BS420_04695 [Cronobacter sakazakii]|nr:hypothetical protein BS420_04695 [Cronobacter sakazakii]